MWIVRVSTALLQFLWCKQIGWKPQQACPHTLYPLDLLVDCFPAEQVPTLLQWIFMQIYTTAQPYLIQNLKLQLWVYLPQYSFNDGKKHGYYSPLPKFISNLQNEDSTLAEKILISTSCCTHMHFLVWSDVWGFKFTNNHRLDPSEVTDVESQLSQLNVLDCLWVFFRSMYKVELLLLATPWAPLVVASL